MAYVELETMSRSDAGLIDFDYLLSIIYFTKLLGFNSNHISLCKLMPSTRLNIFQKQEVILCLHLFVHTQTKLKFPFLTKKKTLFSVEISKNNDIRVTFTNAH